MTSVSGRAAIPAKGLRDGKGRDADAGQRELLARLRAVVEARDAENAELEAERELRRRLGLRLEELERRLRFPAEYVRDDDQLSMACGRVQIVQYGVLRLPR